MRKGKIASRIRYRAVMSIVDDDVAVRSIVSVEICVFVLGANSKNHTKSERETVCVCYIAARLRSSDTTFSKRQAKKSMR